MKNFSLFWLLLLFSGSYVFGQDSASLASDIYYGELEIYNYIEAAFRHVEQKDYITAKKILKEDLKQAYNWDYENLTVWAYYTMARLNYQFDKIDSAQAYLDRIWIFPKKVDASQLLLQANLLQIKLDFQQHKFNSTKKTFDKITVLIAEINHTEQVEKLQKIQQLSKLSATNFHQRQSKVFDQLTIILGILIILILSLLTLSFFKNNTIRRKTNTLLVAKNKQLVKEKEKAEEAILIKNKFLSRITHELRTPIYSVIGLTHLLYQTAPNSEQKNYLKSLQFSGKHLLSLINNILDFNRIEANKLGFVSTRFSLKLEIKNVISSLSKFASDRNNTIHLEMDARLPKMIKGDHFKLAQILINLLNNAIKFTKNGDIWIRVKLNQNEANATSIYFEVEDNGIGIPKDKQGDIFESFTQANQNSTKKHVGSGLGLSIVKGILKAMGGEIQLESQLGVGSKFYFTLVFENYKSENVDEKEGLEKKKNKAAEECWTYLKGKKILIVEDNKINQMITKKILTKKGVSCDLADDGYQALLKHEEQTYDLILMDINMPGISGIEATEKIRETDSATPIIALTAVALDKDIEDLLNKGFNDVIAKPYDTEVFFKKIQEHIQASSKTTGK